jgi:hypothetical protein
VARAAQGAWTATPPVNRILIVGIPRSGTTWVAHVLGHADDVTFLSEPDNHLVLPFALRAKRALPGGFHPALDPGEQAAAYELLWERALGFSTGDASARAYGAFERIRRKLSMRLLESATQRQKWEAFDSKRRPALRLLVAERLSVPERPQARASNLVVKSIYATLSVEWIVARFPARVVVVTRAPLNVLSSWAEIGWLGRPGDDMLDTLEPSARRQLGSKWNVDSPPEGSSIFARGAWLIGALGSELRDAAARNPEWLTVTHEELSERPHEGFRSLVEACGLRWTSAVDRIIDDLNRPGSGYDLFRARAELRDAWRRRLSMDEANEARAVLERFPLDA